MNELDVGDWVLHKDRLAVVIQTNHKAPYRVLIEWLIDEAPIAVWLQRDWVTRSTLTPLAKEVSDILNAVHNHKEK